MFNDIAAETAHIGSVIDTLQEIDATADGEELLAAAQANFSNPETGGGVTIIVH